MRRSSSSAFIDAFRRIMGQTPGAFQAADGTDW